MFVGNSLRRFGWAWAAICLLAGCGEAGQHISGTVTFDGKPVPAGKIYLNPDASQGNSGGSGYANIENGKYDTSLPGGKAPEVMGPMKVLIEGSDPNAKGAASPDDTSGEVIVKSLFPTYETTTVLEEGASTVDFAVPAEAANRRSAPERRMINP